MKHLLFFGQTAFVVTLGTIISPPQFSQPARAANMWRPNGPLVPQPEFVAADVRVAYQPSVEAQKRASARAATRRGESAIARVASGSTGRAYGALIAGITGRARNALSQPLPFAQLVLRSLETGDVVAKVTADENGEFSFDDLSPTGYVVELLGADGSVIAASEMVAATSGGSQVANVRLSGNGTPRAVFGGMMRVSAAGRGNAMNETASEAIAPAARRGATQMQQPETTTSPRL